jgi:GH24 family phage-related lysozyme (muramidase)
MTIDWKFIREKEGVSRKAYVPDVPGSQSGVTIGSGVDLGARSVQDIDRLQISDALKARLKPYALYKKQEAIDYLAAYPLEISDAEMEELDRAAREPLVNTLKNLYDGVVGKTPGLKRFDELPDSIQTVMASVAFQYGAYLSKRTPHFWGLLCTQDWPACVKELENFGDRYTTRRLSEAKLLRTALV